MTDNGQILIRKAHLSLDSGELKATLITYVYNVVT